MKRKFDLILFDLGGVLVHINTRNLWDALGISQPERERLGPLVVQLAHVYEGGRMTTEQFLEEAIRLLDDGRSNEEVRSAMASIIAEPIELMEEIVRKASENFRVGLLSNTNEIHFEYALKRVPALKHIPEYFLSYKIQAMKPDPEIFRRVCASAGVEPARVFFIDDLHENIAAAEKIGFRVHLFDSPRDCAATLSAHGVI